MDFESACMRENAPNAKLMAGLESWGLQGVLAADLKGSWRNMDRSTGVAGFCSKPRLRLNYGIVKTCAHFSDFTGSFCDLSQHFVLNVLRPQNSAAGLQGRS